MRTLQATHRAEASICCKMDRASSDKPLPASSLEIIEKTDVFPASWASVISSVISGMMMSSLTAVSRTLSSAARASGIMSTWVFIAAFDTGVEPALYAPALAGRRIKAFPGRRAPALAGRPVLVVTRAESQKMGSRLEDPGDRLERTVAL